MIPIAYNLRSLAVRRATSLAAAGGIGLVVFVFAATGMLLAGLRATLAGGSHEDVAVVLRAGSEAELTSQFEAPLVARVLARPEVAAGAGEVVVTMSLPRRGGDGISNVILRGVPEASYALRPALTIVAGRMPRPGTEEAMVGRAIAGRLDGAEIGGLLDLTPRRSVHVVGAFAAGGSALESEVWADREIVARAVGREGLASSVRVRLRDPGAVEAFAAGIADDPALGLAAESEARYDERQREGMARFVLGIGLLLCVCFALGGTIGAAVTMHASVAHRQREIGTLRALGFPRRSILTAFLLEALLLAGAGGLLGVGGALALGRVRFSLVNVANWSEVVFRFQPTPAVLLASVAFAALLGLVGGLLPAIRAASVPPIRAIRS